MKGWFLVLLAACLPACGQDALVAFGQTVPFELKPGAKAVWDWKTTGVRQRPRRSLAAPASRLGVEVFGNTLRIVNAPVLTHASLSVHRLDGSRVALLTLHGGAAALPQGVRLPCGSYVGRVMTGSTVVANVNIMAGR